MKTIFLCISYSNLFPPFPRVDYISNRSFSYNQSVWSFLSLFLQGIVLLSGDTLAKIYPCP